MDGACDEQGARIDRHALKLTSQQWLTEREVVKPIWTHDLNILRPARVVSDIALLFVTGGEIDEPTPEPPPAWLLDIARDTGTVVAELRTVPNQPVVFQDDPKHELRSEDDFIAYTWDHFLRTGDDRWPARLPMTKSAVRAMDAVTAFCATAEGGQVRVARFVVAGASKRGWTTWTTAAVDARVVAIAPVVIDVLNLEASFAHHWQAYGAWAPAVKDYVDQGIMNWLGTPAFRALDANRRTVRVPRAAHDAQADTERVGRRVLPAGFVAVLHRSAPGRNEPALRAERRSWPGTY